jgi:hypothetical protein
MNITDRFLETLNEFKIASGSDEIALLDKSQATAVLNLIDQTTAGALTQEQLKQQLTAEIESFDSRTMSKTIAGHILKEIS